jgi:acyl-CoA thioester hydrolase
MASNKSADEERANNAFVSTEYVLSTNPFTVRRRVKFGECDPAGVAYTVVFSEYVISAAELFYGFLFGSTPQRVRDQLNFATPTRALEFDFRRGLWPDDEFDMSVAVADIRRSTYVLEVTARTPAGAVVFSARLTPICIVLDQRRAIAIPEPFRAALERYRAATAGTESDAATQLQPQ